MALTPAEWRIVKERGLTAFVVWGPILGGALPDHPLSLPGMMVRRMSEDERSELKGIHRVRVRGSALYVSGWGADWEIQWLFLLAVGDVSDTR